MGPRGQKKRRYGTTWRALSLTWLQLLTKRVELVLKHHNDNSHNNQESKRTVLETMDRFVA
jgi:hypothetical protein